MFCKAQDHTTIELKPIKNDELRLINELNNIQFINLICSDTLQKNKRFFLSIDEYNRGELKNSDNLNLTCKEHMNKVVVGSDTLIFAYNPCDKIKYENTDKAFKVQLAGKLVKDTFNLILSYPGIRFKLQLKGSKNHLLRNVIQTKKDKATIALKNKTPIMAYTGPFETGGGSNSYCILDQESPTAWYKKYGVKHFYIINLEIK